MLSSYCLASNEQLLWPGSC